jgi:hypothetical protein
VREDAVLQGFLRGAGRLVEHQLGEDAYQACLSVIADVEQCLGQIIGTARSLAPAA